jgi:hypothetical protein
VCCWVCLWVCCVLQAGGRPGRRRRGRQHGARGGGRGRRRRRRRHWRRLSLPCHQIHDRQGVMCYPRQVLPNSVCSPHCRLGPCSALTEGGWSPHVPRALQVCTCRPKRARVLTDRSSEARCDWACHYPILVGFRSVCLSHRRSRASSRQPCRTTRPRPGWAARPRAATRPGRTCAARTTAAAVALAATWSMAAARAATEVRAGRAGVLRQAGLGRAAPLPRARQAPRCVACGCPRRGPRGMKERSTTTYLLLIYY